MKNRVLKMCGFAVACVLCTSTAMTAQAFLDEDSTPTWTWAKEHIEWAYKQDIIDGKGDHRFDADGIVTRAEAATMLVKFKGIDAELYDMPCEQFEDVADEWYTIYINAAYDNGLVAGKTENIFDPEGKLTRAEAATLIVSAMDYDLLTEQDASFVDIEGAWYTPYINTAYEHEIVAGKGEGIFQPNASVSRAEMVTMIHATLKENYEIGDIDMIFLGFGVEDYSFTNADGQMLKYDASEGTYGTFSGEMEATTDMLMSLTGWDFQVQESTSFTFESSNKEVTGLSFVGSNSVVSITGSNMDKVQVNADGTIYLYGTNMEYKVLLTNVAHTLEYSETGADDVVLKVANKELVEVEE